MSVKNRPSLSCPDLPPFTDAAEQFRSFIDSQGHDADIAWIFRQDVVELGGQIFVRQPLLNNESLVEAKYEEGVERGLGVSLQVFCWLDGRPLCYIWLPEDQVDADYRMLSGLKMSVPADPTRRQGEQSAQVEMAVVAGK